MKNTTTHKAATTTCILAALILASCIYEAPDDRFYRTLWESSDSHTPFGPVTLEFLCGEKVSVSAPGTIGSFGSYAPTGATATFTGLTLTRDTLTARLIHAHRQGDKLTLLLGIDGSYPDLPSEAAGPYHAQTTDRPSGVTGSADGPTTDIPPGATGSADDSATDIPSRVIGSADGPVLNSDGVTTHTITMHRLSAYK